jgi:hypothetical protein
MLEKNTKEYCDFIFVIPGKEFTQEFILSWSATLSYLAVKGFSFRYFFYYTSIVSVARNRLLQFPVVADKADRNEEIFSGLYKCKKVIFIDSDIIWTIEDLEKLLFTPHDFLSGAYRVNRQGDDCISVLSENGSLMNSKEFSSKEQIFESRGTGFGFVSCSYELLESMKYPWFVIENPSDGSTEVGEDIFFCKKAASLGYKIMVDPTIKVGHIKNIILTV